MQPRVRVEKPLEEVVAGVVPDGPVVAREQLPFREQAVVSPKQVVGVLRPRERQTRPRPRQFPFDEARVVAVDTRRGPRHLALEPALQVRPAVVRRRRPRPHHPVGPLVVGVRQVFEPVPRFPPCVGPVRPGDHLPVTPPLYRLEQMDAEKPDPVGRRPYPPFPEVYRRPREPHLLWVAVAPERPWPVRALRLLEHLAV